MRMLIPVLVRPNEISQSNISPEDAVPLWKEYMTPLKAKGYKLGMAAPTNAPNGLEWVKVRPNGHIAWLFPY